MRLQSQLVKDSNVLKLGKHRKPIKNLTGGNEEIQTNQKKLKIESACW